MNKFPARKIAFLGVLAALTAISYIIESLLPTIAVPGAKLGLANAFITVCLALFSLPEAFLMLAVKLVVSAIFGGASQLIYSLPAGIVALAVSYLLLRPLSKFFSLTAACTLAAVVHNLIQISIFSALTSTPLPLYAALLTAMGAISGVCCALASYYLCLAASRIFPAKENAATKDNKDA